MLGISFNKLVVLVVLILVVWYGFKYARRLDEVRQALRRAQDSARSGRGGATKIVAEDMVKCPTCGAYVTARGATKCGRSDCPY